MQRCKGSSQCGDPQGPTLQTNRMLNRTLIMTYMIEILEIIAWPSTILILVWIARSPILSLLPAIQRIRFQGAEIELSQSLQEIENSIAMQEDMKLEDRLLNREIKNALDLPPSHLVLEVWSVLERSARTTVERVLPNEETFRKPLDRPIDYLEFKGALTPSTATAIRDLRDLRNQVARFSGSDIPKEQSFQFANLANRIVNVIESIDALPKVKLTALTLLILEINHLIDSGNYNDVTIDEVYTWIKAENIIPALTERAKEHVDLSPYGIEGPYSNFADFYHGQMKVMYFGYGGDHGREWGVENLGLCLLLAWTNEMVQRGSGWYPDEM